jgi:hypothetical protein
MELEVFLRKENIERYQRLINSGTRAAERRKIFKSLSDEMQKLTNGVRRPASCSGGRASSRGRRTATHCDSDL